MLANGTQPCNGGHHDARRRWLLNLSIQSRDHMLSSAAAPDRAPRPRQQGGSHAATGQEMQLSAAPMQRDSMSRATSSAGDVVDSVVALYQCQSRTCARVPSMIGEAACMAAVDAATSLPAPGSDMRAASCEVLHQWLTCCDCTAWLAWRPSGCLARTETVAMCIQDAMLTSNDEGDTWPGRGWSGRPVGQADRLSS